MEPAKIIIELSNNGKVFKELLENPQTEMITWKPAPNKWCLLEIVCHLLDEEREDFRARVAHILSTPELPLTKIAPHNWPIEGNYLDQDFYVVLKEFLAERQESIVWLKSLKNPKWEQTVDDPEVGPRSAKKFLVNWLAHDYLHIRQINAIKHNYLKITSGDDLTYAGNW